MKFKAILVSVKKGREGDVKIALEVSKLEARNMMDIPEETTLDIEINPGEVVISED